MNESGLENEYPGIGRLHYFLAHIGMIAAVVFVVTVFGPESPVMSITGLVLLLASFSVWIIEALDYRSLRKTESFTNSNHFAGKIFRLRSPCRKVKSLQLKALESNSDAFRFY